MNLKNLILIFCTIFLLLLTSCTSSQTPEELVNEGKSLIQEATFDAPGDKKEELTKKAIKNYDRAIEINPEYAEAWNQKGAALLFIQKPEEAIVCFDKALEIDKEHGYAWYNKGAALYRLKKYEEALSCIEKAMEFLPGENDATAIRQLIEQELKKGN